MKLYDAIQTVVNEFGSEIVTNTRVINLFSDYNAFEESRTFKVILKNLVNEGYMDQLLYVKDWAGTQERIINNFIKATSFNEANARYVIQSVAYGLGYTKVAPEFIQGPSNSSTSADSSFASSTASSPYSNSDNQGRNEAPGAGIVLDKTEEEYNALSYEDKRAYKEKAEAYLESIIEFKSDFERDLGIKLQTSVAYNGYYITPTFEISGKIKVKYDFSLMFHVMIYDSSNRIIAKEEIYVGERRKSFEVCEASFRAPDFHTVGNIKRIVVYWESDD